MGTSLEYIDYVCEQIAGVGEVRSRKMFGEYMVYINDKPIILVCDNTVYVKILDCLDEKMKEAEKGFPYDGAKMHYILDIDNATFCKEVITILEPIIPVPKKKKKSKHK
jgi:TfoX/Sxy family transcriptional regulator of competence genes